MDRRRMVIGSTVVALVALAALVIVFVSRDRSASDEVTMAQVSAPTPDPIPTPTPDPTPAEILWAGQVCTSISALKAVAGTLPESALQDFDPSRDLAVQAQEQVDKVMVKLQGPLDELGFALGSVPVEYTDAAVALTEAQTLYDTAQSQVTATQDTISDALSASNPVEGIVLFGQAIDSGRQAYETGQKLVTVLEGLDSDERLRGSFGKAPECRSL